MARDITFVMQGNQMDLQNLEGTYFAPIREFDLQTEIPNWETMNTHQLQQVLTDTFDNVKDNNGDKMSFWSKDGEDFAFRDGKTDVYTKEGLNYEIFEYLERQVGDDGLWRIKTNETSIDFKAGGMIIVGGREYKILKVVNAFIEGTMMNKFSAMKTPDDFYRYANKIMAVVG